MSAGMVWNRLRYIKDPDTGKRVSRLNPERDWVVNDVPALRIIDDELWQAVQARHAGVQRSGSGRAREAASTSSSRPSTSSPA